MATKEWRAILGVEPDADDETIRRAYRRIAFASHPDVGEPPNAERFREAHDAYQGLIVARKRRAAATAPEHSIALNKLNKSMRAPAGWMRAPEPLRARAISFPGDFLSVAPSLGEILDHIAQNFFGFHQKSAGPRRRLAVEIVLDPEERRWGCRAPLELPVYARCQRCGGHEPGWLRCPECHGYGMVETKARLVLEVPPGVRVGDRFEIGLEPLGISNLRLEARIVAE